MQYQFDKIIDRSSTSTLKYDDRQRVFGKGDVIPLWVADMDFQTAQPIVDACVRRAQHGIYGYSGRPGSYLQAAVDFQKRRHNWEIDPSTISYAVGVMPAVSELIRMLTQPGDQILIQPPVYMEFAHAAGCWEGRTPCCNQLVENPDGSWDIDFSDFEEKLKTCRVFLLCNPHNPVGRIWRYEELVRMAELCLQYQVPMLVDEIHGDIALFGNHYIPAGTLPEHLKKNMVCCFSATKTFNLAGLQACCVVFHNPQWQARFQRTWDNYEIDRNNSFSLVAMEAAWRDGDEWLDQLLVYLSGNVQYVCDFVETRLPGIRVRRPEVTYLCWLDCRALGMTNEAMNRFFVEEAGVGLNDGARFGLSGYMRLNTACPRPVLEQAMEQIAQALERRRS